MSTIYSTCTCNKHILLLLGDYTVQGESDNVDSDVSLTIMHSRLQKLVFDHVDNEAGLAIVDFESNDGREMKHKLLVRSIFYYLP